MEKIFYVLHILQRLCFYQTPYQLLHLLHTPWSAKHIKQIQKQCKSCKRLEDITVYHNLLEAGYIDICTLYAHRKSTSSLLF